VVRVRHTLGDVRAVLAGRRPARDPRRPDFIGIGGQKCGTTWLDRMLRRHPGAAMADCKEMHYFNRSLHRSPRAYFAHFPAGDDRIRGEITPAYALLSPRRIAFVHRLLPDLRIVMLLRDPVERAWSQLRMNLIDIPGRAMDTVTVDEVRAAAASPAVRRRSAYVGAIARWTARYPKDRLCIGYHREIVERPWDLLERVFAHVGLASPDNREAFGAEARVLPVTRAAGATERVPVRFREVLEECFGSERTAAIEYLGADAARWLPAVSEDAAEGA
jgi:hypothetical protein